MQALHLTLILPLSDLRQVRSVSGDTVLDEIGLARVATGNFLTLGTFCFCAIKKRRIMGQQGVG
jgi:hypothetical protein